MRPRAGLALIAAALVLAAVALAGCGDDTDAQRGPAGAGPMTGMSSATADVARAGDVMFARMMIPHHEQAVEMSDIALGKPDSSPEVRQLATQIKAAQLPEIDLMRSWLTEWGVPAMPTSTGRMGHGAMMGMLSAADLDRLEQATGAELDRLWLTGMIEHHRGAISMAQQVTRTTEDPAVKELADSIISSQQDEIAAMEALLGQG